MQPRRFRLAHAACMAAVKQDEEFLGRDGPQPVGELGAADGGLVEPAQVVAVGQQVLELAGGGGDLVAVAGKVDEDGGLGDW